MSGYLEAEKRQSLHWIPVLLGLGIALYFALPFEPQGFPLLVAAGVSWVGFASSRKYRPVLGVLALGVSLICTGLVAAKLRSDAVSAPVLERWSLATPLEGRVVALEPASPGHRILLNDLRLERGNAAPPRRIRLRYNGDLAGIAVGDRVDLFAVLKPPPGPVSPWGFDFARYAFFQEIGAVGYVRGKPKLLEKAERQEGALFWSNLRRAIQKRVHAVLAGPQAELAVTFLTGQKGGLDAGTREEIRRAGLSHLLAISGLHMGLVAGILFFAARFVLALFPAIALRFPIKKWAACLAGLGCVLFLLLIGAPVPTQRAFIMIAVALLAVLLDRRAISMRSVAVAAGLVLLLHPEVLVGVSFQLSFAAVIALVALFEVWTRRSARSAFGEGLLGRIGTAFTGSVVCSLIASLATAPFVAYHFNEVPLYGLVANAVAVPLTAFAIMPLVLLTYLLMPLGLEALSLVPLDWSLTVLLQVARFVADLPGGALPIAQFPPWSLWLFVAGGLWLCLWQRPWRFWGMPVIALSVVAMAAFPRAPDLLISDRDAFYGIVHKEALFLPSLRRERFTAEVWQEELGGAAVREIGALPKEVYRCDPVGCLLKVADRRVAFIEDGLAFEEDCARADLVVTWLKAPKWCAAQGARVLDRAGLFEEGAQAVWLGNEIRIESAGDYRGQRPWVR